MDLYENRPPSVETTARYLDENKGSVQTTAFNMYSDTTLN